MKIKYFSTLLIVTLFMSLLTVSCVKEESLTTTIITDSSTSKTQVKITVEDLSGNTQASRKIDMFDKEISDVDISTVIKSKTTNSDGVAIFDLKDLATNTPKTFYFGVFKKIGESYELLGSKKVTGIQLGKEISTNLVLTN